MRIIKEGDPKRLKKTIKFMCNRCGCLFEANEGEYTQPDYLASVHDNIKAECKCPYCKKTVYVYEGSFIV